MINPVYELQRDEFLHLDQAKHLAWGFHSVPPFSSWVSWVILQFGNTVFWVKFFPALFGALTILVVWKTVERLNGGLFACTLAALSLLLSVLLRINMLYQPNSFDILCWTLIYYTVICYIQTNRPLWLYLLAVSFAIGFLNKYNIAFCLLGLFPALLLTKHRSLFAKPEFYFSIILAITLISPNLVWQIENDFPVFKHMKELADTQLIHVNRLDFLKEQLFFFVGSLFVLLAAFFSFFYYAPFKPYRLLFFAFVFTISIFVLLKAKAYYAIGLYPIFFAFGASYLSQLFKKGRMFYFRYAAFAVILLFAYPLIAYAMPIFEPEKYAQRAIEKKPFSEHVWEDGKKHAISQDFADMLGWKNLAGKVDSLYNTTTDKRHLLILCDNYGQAGAINYYTKIPGLQAHCFNTDYDKWVNLNNRIDIVIRVKAAENVASTRDLALFNNVRQVSSLNNQYARENGTQIILLSQPKIDLAALLRKERAAGNLQ